MILFGDEAEEAMLNTTDKSVVEVNCLNED